MFLSRRAGAAYGRAIARSPTRIGLPLARETPEIPLYTGDMVADLQVVSRNKLAETITGGLSFPSKMPCPAWGISASRCRVGQVLARQPGTVCSGCYAMAGTFTFPAVQRKLEARFAGLAHPLWTPAMVFLIRYLCDRHFRWFESGDLPGVIAFKNILTVCRHTRDVLHWLPTRESAVVRECADEIPENLTVRVSANRIDAEPASWWPTTSTVVSTQEAGDGICPAPENQNACGECRACWDREVPNVAYRLH